MPPRVRNGLFSDVGFPLRQFSTAKVVRCIGSDFDGFTDPPDTLKDAFALPKLTQPLVAEGYSREQIVKIWGGNALRALREGWGKKE